MASSCLLLFLCGGQYALGVVFVFIDLGVFLDETTASIFEDADCCLHFHAILIVLRFCDFVMAYGVVI